MSLRMALLPLADTRPEAVNWSMLLRWDSMIRELLAGCSWAWSLADAPYVLFMALAPRDA